MISYEEALEIIASQAQLFEDELISLDDADGRILAEDIYADRNYPPFNRAAMDGFAILLSDWEIGIRKYKILEVIYAGQASLKTISSGECYKIMTGAAVPLTANAIIRREDSVQEDKEVTLSAKALNEFKNISREGEDSKKGDLLIKCPQICTPQIISLLASVGKSVVKVKNLPQIAIITTGNEVVLPGEEISQVTIRNSNRYLLKSLLKTWNIIPTICEHVKDDKNHITEVLENAIENDIIIINGGVSAGDADYVPAVLKELGVTELFYKVNIKPGKPLWVGKSKKGIVFALPGNPLSCLTTFTIFIESYLYQIFGFNERPFKLLPLLESRKKKNTLTEFFPVIYDVEHNGLRPKPYNGSGDITSGVNCDGLAEHLSEYFDIKSGTFIKYYQFNKK